MGSNDTFRMYKQTGLGNSRGIGRFENRIVLSGAELREVKALTMPVPFAEIIFSDSPENFHHCFATFHCKQGCHNQKQDPG